MSFKQLITICGLSTLLLFSFTFAQQYAEGEVIVKYKETGMQTFSLMEVSNTMSIQNISATPEERIFLIQGKKGETTQELLDLYAQHPHIEYVQPNYKYNVFFSPNDPYYGNLR